VAARCVRVDMLSGGSAPRRSRPSSSVNPADVNVITRQRREQQDPAVFDSSTVALATFGPCLMPGYPGQADDHGAK
jgi:hypothetical protein